MDVMSVAVAIKEIGAKAVQSALDSLGKAASNASGKLQSTDKAAQDLTGSFRTLAGAVGAAFSAQQIGVALDSYTNLTNQLKLASTGAEGLAAAQAEVYQIAQLTRQPINEVANLYAKTARSAETLGLSQAEVGRLTEFVGKAIAVSGSSSEAAAGALTQLSQAFAAGTVRAEEFNSIQEGAPALIQAVEKSLGLASGGLRKLALEGKLSSEMFATAMLANTTVSEQFAAFVPTMSQQITTLRNDFVMLAGEINKSADITGVFARLVDTLRRNLPEIAGLIAAAAGAWAGYQAAAFAASATTAILGSAGTISALLSLARTIKTVADGIAFAQIALGAAGGPAKVLATVAAMAAGLGAYKLISGQVQKSMDAMAASTMKQAQAAQQGAGQTRNYSAELEKLLAKAKTLTGGKTAAGATEPAATPLNALVAAAFAEIQAAQKKIALSIAAAPDPLMSSMIAGLDAKRDEMIAAYERNVLEPAREMGQQLNQILSAGLANAFQALTARGGTIGDAFKALGQTILSGLGDMLIQLGTSLLPVAKLMAAVRASLASLSPAGMVAAAVGLIALGGMMKGMASRMTTTGAGAPVSSGGFGYTAGGQGGITLPGLTFGPTMAAAAAGGLSPMQPMNVTIIGPNDPSAQRQMQELLRNAQRRGGTTIV
jgi:tape measure domain-containing protein